VFRSSRSLSAAISSPLRRPSELSTGGHRLSPGPSWLRDLIFGHREQNWEFE
jgi:hypothetical protein